MSPKNKKKRKELDDSEDSIEAKMEEIKDPATIVAHFRKAERRELEAMILLKATVRIPQTISEGLAFGRLDLSKLMEDCNYAGVKANSQRGSMV
ncbi:hypothetical protein HNY73_020456 [Argiope bruennichi]|uniref:Uncharacterized protein n=1 Tax=Argiope bruennichi TaxID=94029 RepID=A0A8T0E9F0_ARGBR|nr:hypothetical protein HNY73_020456 [Argiope bruennichi]